MDITGAVMMLCNGTLFSQPKVTTTNSVEGAEVGFEGILSEAMLDQIIVTEEGNLNTGEAESNIESDKSTTSEKDDLSDEKLIFSENDIAPTITLNNEQLYVLNHDAVLSDFNNIDAKIKEESTEVKNNFANQSLTFASETINKEEKAELLLNLESTILQSPKKMSAPINNVLPENGTSIESANVLQEVQNEAYQKISFESKMPLEQIITESEHFENNLDSKFSEKSEYILPNDLGNDLNLRSQNVTENSVTKTDKLLNQNIIFNNINDQIRENIIVKSDVKDGNYFAKPTSNRLETPVEDIKAEIIKGKPIKAEAIRTQAFESGAFESESFESDAFRPETIKLQSKKVDSPKSEEFVIRQPSVSVNQGIKNLSNDNKEADSIYMKENIAAIKSSIISEAKKGIDSEFAIKLKPEGLGEVTVELKQNGDQLEVLIKTKLSTTGELIAGEVKNLQASLNSEQTIEFHQVSVGVEYGFGETGNSMAERQNDYRSENYQTNTEFEVASEEAETIHNIVNKLRRGLIDYTA